MQRLDKFLTNNTLLSRSEATKAIKNGRVFVDGKIANFGDVKIDEQSASVVLDGENVSYKRYTYIMLNKPNGVVSATEDNKQKTVIDLLPQEYKKKNLFPCGRLDKDTLGLVILTNDGTNSHRLLSPKNHISKTYEFECADPLTLDKIIEIENGVELRDGYKTKPCKIELFSKNSGKITIYEGKYHEIRRIFGAMGNKITFLKRISFGQIQLDKSLNYGEFRELNLTEQNYFTNK